MQLLPGHSEQHADLSPGQAGLAGRQYGVVVPGSSAGQVFSRVDQLTLPDAAPQFVDHNVALVAGFSRPDLGNPALQFL